MTQQSEKPTTIPAQLAERFHHGHIPANIASRCEGAEPICPKCGAPCNHTPQEMQGFAMDAAEEASAGLARDEEACRRAMLATGANAAQRDEFSNRLHRALNWSLVAGFNDLYAQLKRLTLAMSGGPEHALSDEAFAAELQCAMSMALATSDWTLCDMLGRLLSDLPALGIPVPGEEGSVAKYRGSGDNLESKTIALLTQQVAELRSTPPTTFVQLENDGTFQEWMRMLAENSMTGKMRKATVRALRDLVTACAEAQRSASVAELYKSAAAGNWLRLEDGLPAPYEEVRILFNGTARIARLTHDKSYFQLASFMGNAKHQYIAKLEEVQGWQPLIAAPGIPVDAVTPAAGV